MHRSAYLRRKANRFTNDETTLEPAPFVELNVPVVDVPIVIVEVDVTVNPAGNCPTFALCGLLDKINWPFPLSSVVIVPTEVPSIDTSSDALSSIPLTRTRRI